MMNFPLVSIACFALTIQMAAQTGFRASSPMVDRGIRLVASGEPDFLEVYAAATTEGKRRLLEPVLPFLAVLVNNSAAPLLGYSLRLEWTDSFGRPRIGVFDYVNFHPDALPTRFRRGDSRVVSALDGLSRELVGHALNNDLLQRYDQPLSEFRKAQSLSLTVDSVLLEDGSVLGPDRSNSFGRWRAQIEAEAQFLGEIAALLRGNASDEQILNRLQSIQSPGPGRFDDPSRVFVAKQSRIARSLAYGMKQHGRAALQPLLSYSAPITLKRGAER